MSQELVKINTAGWGVLQATPDQSLQLMREAAGSAGLRSSDLPTFKLPPQGMTSWMLDTIDGQQIEKELQAIVLAFTDRRAYWPHAYGQGGDPIPDCYSDDCITPSPLSRNAQSEECFSCKHNQFGSALQGGGKACRERKVLFVLTPTQGIPTIINLPPTSLKDVRKYLINLAANGTRCYDVITGITLKPGKNNAPVAQFRSLGRVPAEQRELVAKYAGFINEVAARVALSRADYEEGSN